MTDNSDIAVRNLEVRFRDRIELARSYLSSPPHGGFAVPAPGFIRSGEMVLLKVQVVSEQIAETVVGMVIWTRSTENRQTMAGIALFESEVDRREALLNSVTPKFPSSKERREDRFDVSLTATYQTPHEFVVDKVLNISNGGVFIESNNMPEEGSDIEIRVYPSEVEDAIDLVGQVVWNKSGQGFGVRLTEPEPSERALLDRLIRRLAERTTPKK